MNFVLIAIIACICFILLFRKRLFKSKNQFRISAKSKIILSKNIDFYKRLNTKEKKVFENRISDFLNNCSIRGIGTNIELIDKLLVASSAIIPIWAFPKWKYTNIDEVLMYESSFNEQFQTKTDDSNILGMVGSGPMEGKMILSKLALHHGFSNSKDKKNTAIHEFVHLIDKSDGEIDGIPKLLLDKQYSIPWLNLIQKKIDEIRNANSEINPYGATNSSEFLAVISEYFFEQPHLLNRKHPELYSLLEKIFCQKPTKFKLPNTIKQIYRNDKCPCMSGLKYKKCCGKLN